MTEEEAELKLRHWMWRIRTRGGRKLTVRRPTPEMMEAGKLFKRAVLKGILKRPDSCSKCGAVPTGDERIHGHHWSYARPLDVIWLCCKCHLRVHKVWRDINILTEAI